MFKLSTEMDFKLDMLMSGSCSITRTGPPPSGCGERVISRRAKENAARP